MSQPPSERDRGGDEDLFEDLDQFFAPLEDSGWTGEGDAAGGEADAAVEGFEDLDPMAIQIPEEDELVGGRAEEPGGPAPSTAEEASDEAALSQDEAFLLAQEREPPDSEPAAAWSADEAEGGEWDALRASAGHQAGTPAAAREGDEPLSLEDLKAAPPEYADLPGPDQEPEAPGEEPAPEPASRVGEEEPLPADEAVIGSLADLEALEEPVSPQEEPEHEGFATAPIDVEPMGEQDEPPAAEREARPVDVEAAADHFATGMRDSPAEVEEDLLSDLGEQPGVQAVRIDPSAAVDQAPAWEEVGARPVEAEPAEEAAATAAPARRNLTAAFASGLLLLAAVIALLAIGKGPFAVLAIGVLLLGQAEFYAVLRSRGYRPATLLGLVAGAFVAAGAYLKGEGAVLLGLFIAMAAGALWYMAAPAERRKGLSGGVGATLLGVVYVPFLGAFALLLLRPAGSIGITLFLTVAGLTILYDVFAFAVGSWFGSRPLAPSVSPSKSWEGAIGATFVVLLVGIAIVPSLEPFEPATAVGLALVISALAPIGDLIESAFKRDLGVKDMSGLLPGHGGILDRIDALLITAPAAYYFLRIVL